METSWRNEVAKHGNDEASISSIVQWVYVITFNMARTFTRQNFSGKYLFYWFIFINSHLLKKYLKETFLFCVVHHNWFWPKKEGMNVTWYT